MTDTATDPTIQCAIALLKSNGYRVSVPRAMKAIERPTLNALGKPMSPLFDPNWKRKTTLTSIARLRAPQVDFPWRREDQES